MTTPLLLRDADRTMSETCLIPGYSDSTKRTLTLFQAIFTLVGGMIGGGMLSLPFALSKAGLIWGGIIALGTGFAAERTMGMLVVASRDVGGPRAASFGGLAEVVLGVWGKRAAGVLLFAVCMLASVSYAVLGGRLIGEAVMEDAPSKETRRLASVCFGIAALPLSSMPRMDALKYASVMSVVSIGLLLGCVLWYAAKEPRPWDDLRLWPLSLVDGIFALPFFIGSFAVHFAVLPVHAELMEPTRVRSKNVVRAAVGIGYVLYSIIAFAGYAHAGSQVCDTIFSNFSHGAPIVRLGRIGMTLTLFFSYPLFMLPARRCVSEFISVDVDESLPQRVGTTVVLIAVSTTIAVVASSLSFVISVTGSTVTTMVCFTIPLLIDGEVRGRTWRHRMLRRFLALASILMSVACTVATFLRMDLDPCEAQ